VLELIDELEELVAAVVLLEEEPPTREEPMLKNRTATITRIDRNSMPSGDVTPCHQG